MGRNAAKDDLATANIDLKVKSLFHWILLLHGDFVTQSINQSINPLCVGTAGELPPGDGGEGFSAAGSDKRSRNTFNPIPS